MSADASQAAGWLLAAGGSPRTIYHNRCALAFLFSQILGKELDPRVVPRIRHIPAKVALVADPEELSAIFAAIIVPETRRFCQFVYATGMRLREAQQVRIDDIDAKAGTVLVRMAKGGRQRRAILSESLLRVLRRQTANRLPDEPLFGTSVQRMDGDIVAGQLREARRRAGIAKRITLHTLRHSFATHLHERGVGVCELRLLLGHTSLLTTMHYIGLRERRRADIAQIDLLASLPDARPGQASIEWG